MLRPTWQGSDDLNEVYNDALRLGLQSNLTELEAYGFSVVGDVLSEDVVKTARDEILFVAEKQTGVKPNLQTGEGYENFRLIPYLLARHPVFQDILLNDRALTLVTYLLGWQCLLSSMTCHLKGPGRGGEISLHTDTWMPAPLPRYAHVATVNYALVDYSKDAGSLAIVPASHQRARNPGPEEAALSGERKNSEAIPIEMSAGSMAIWHGNTWHGSYPRTIPGLRLNLSLYFVRPWMKVAEIYGNNLPAEVVVRHGSNPRFRQLAGLNEILGWTEEGPSYLDPKENLSVSPSASKTESEGKKIRYGSRSWHS